MQERFDRSLAACRAVGIPDRLIKAWSEGAEPGLPKVEADDKVVRIDFDGPVVPTDMHAFYKYQDGLVSPGGLRKALKEADGAPVNIVINSPGGSAFDGIAMYGDLLKYDGEISVTVSGMCFSAATFFLCLPDTHRDIMPGSEVMIHNAWTVAMGDYREMEKAAKQLRRLGNTIATNYAKRSTYDKTKLVEMMDDETWMTPEEALEGGFVDAIYDMEVEEEDESEDESDAENSIKPDAVVRAEACRMEVLELCYHSDAAIGGSS